MNVKRVFPIVLGLLIGAIIIGGLFSNAEDAYAMGPNPGLTDHARLNGNRCGPVGPASSVPEPSTLASLGAGVAGLGVYLYSRRTKKK